MRPSHLLPALFAAFLGITPLHAQSGVLTVGWDATSDPGVTAYRVYYGAVSTSLGLMAEVPAAQTSVLLTGLVPLTTYFVEVTSVRATGCESGRSPTISGLSSNPGPICQTAVPAGTLLQGRTNQTITITGAGLEPGVVVRFFAPPLDQVMTVRSQTLTGSTRLVVSADVKFGTPPDDQATPVGPVSVELKNLDPTQPAASCVNAFSVAFNTSRTDVNGSGRADGFDFALFGVGFGAFDRRCTPDAPNAPARGTRCDTETDCGGGGTTTFCTDRACAIAAPSNDGVACNAEADCGGTAGVTAFCVASPYRPAVDLDGDGLIDGADVSLFSAQYGKNISP
jgi:hypothetical protein